MIYYISGKITNGESEQPNFKYFFEAEELLWKREDCTTVFNPAKLEEKEYATWEHYLARDVKYIIDNRPTLYMLPNWEESKGARLEHELAKLLDLPIEYASRYRWPT